MSINEVRYLPECGSTNAYVKEHFEEFGPVGAVYTENQTAGRGRLGRSWVNAEGKAKRQFWGTDIAAGSTADNFRKAVSVMIRKLLVIHCQKFRL